MKKKNQIFLSALCCGISVFAQSPATHRLTSVQNAYRAGDNIIKQQVEYKDAGSKGANLTWDFRHLQPINEEYSLKYFIPDSTLMDKLCGLEHRTRYYYLQRNDSLLATGFENATTLMDYVQPELKMRFPFSYGDTLYSTFEGIGQYSHRLDLQVRGYTRVEADAEGDLLLPNFETLRKALRVHTLRYYTQTDPADLTPNPSPNGEDSSGSGLQMSIDTYSWYAAGVRYPVFESIKTNLIRRDLVRNISTMDTTVFTTSFYYPPNVGAENLPPTNETLTNENTPETAETVFTNADYFPTPITDNLNITYTLSRSAQIWFSVHSALGLPIVQTTPQMQQAGNNSVQLNLSGQTTGSYTLYIHVDNMVMQRVVIKN